MDVPDIGPTRPDGQQPEDDMLRLSALMQSGFQSIVLIVPTNDGESAIQVPCNVAFLPRVGDEISLSGGIKHEVVQIIHEESSLLDFKSLIAKVVIRKI